MSLPVSTLAERQAQLYRNTQAYDALMGQRWQQPTPTPPPQVPVATPPAPTAEAPLDPQQLAAVLYDKAIPIGFSTRAQWGGRLIEGPVFGVLNNERVVSFIAGYYIPINFWDATRTVSELYFRGQLAWTQSGGALLSGLNVGVATANGVQTVRFATGTLAQTPDAWSVARYGAQAVAYVPLVTATFENIRIAQFGNVVPFTSVTVDDTAYGTPGDLVAWADAIEALAQYEGRGPDEFETVDVTGVLNALILGSDITFIDFLAAMRKHKPQWNILTAEKLRLVEKGLFSLDLTLERAKLVSHGAQPIVVHSSDAFDKPREKVCHYLDVARDYEPSNVRVAEDIDPVISTDSFATDSYDIPVASTADIVMAETSFAYYTGEVARQQSEFSGMAHYLGLEPGDCYKWTSAAGRTFYHRVNEIVRRADFTVDAKGEGFLNCAIVPTEPPTGSGLVFEPATAVAVTLSGANLTATHASAATNSGVRTDSYRTSGKYYFEATVGTTVGYSNMFGIMELAATYANFVSGGILSCAVGFGAGYIFSNNVSIENIGAIAAGDVISAAIDLTARKGWFRKNGGIWNNIGTYNPATGTGGVIIGAGSFTPAAGFGGVFSTAGDSMTYNFGASAYAYAPPAGFSNWPP